MTIYDLIMVIWVICKGSILVLFFLALVILIVYMLMHPEKVREWNAILTEKAAGASPKRQKKAFEKKISISVDSAMQNFAAEFPTFQKRFMPYDLKVEWISSSDDRSPEIVDKRAIIYVRDYRDDARQAIMVINNYVRIGFAEKAKFYMAENISQPVDILVTKKVIQSSKPYILSYFNREYLPGQFCRTEKIRLMYDDLCKIDAQGLFVPIFLNEIDKFACNIYPLDNTVEIENAITNFFNFVLTIATKINTETVPTFFNEGGICVKILLAVPDGTIDITPYLDIVDRSIDMGATIYIIASGLKIPFAEQIAKQSYGKNHFRLDEPRLVHYKRHGKRLMGTDAVCYELTQNSFYLEPQMQ